MGQIGSGTTGLLALGIAVGIVGTAGMGVNYPIYKRLLETASGNTPTRFWSLPARSASSEPPAPRTGDALSARPRVPRRGRALAANFTYALFRGVTGALAGSVWSLSLAAYHLVLGVMRDESLLYIQGDPRVHPGYAMKKGRPSGRSFFAY